MSSIDEEIELCDVSSKISPSKQSSLSKTPQKPPRGAPIGRKIRPKSQLDLTSDDISEITNSESTSRSDIRSYRDKIRDRFMAVKNQSLRKTTKLKRFKSHASNILNLNRSIELMRRENLDIVEKIRQKQVVVQESSGNLTKTQMYHFFCESLTNYNTENDMELSNVAKSTEQLIIDSTVVCKAKANYLLDDIFETEHQILWSPSSKKLIATDVPRDECIIYEAGVYAPGKPNIQNKNIILIQNRLLANEDIHWFNKDNELIFLENPYNKIAYRPFEYSSDCTIQTTYHKASMDAPIELNSVTILADDILEVNIQSLKFKHHSLFSTEHVLEELLIELYDVHREFVINNKVERLEQKLHALRSTRSSMEHAEADTGCLATYNNKIYKLREEYFHESKKYRDNIKSILRTWKYIKQIRKVNKYSNTSIKLNIRKEMCENDFHEKFEICFKEIVSEQELEYHQLAISYKEQLTEWKKDKTKAPKPRKPVNNIDPESIRDDLEIIFRDAFREPGEPKLSFNITHDNEITKSPDNGLESSRRNAVESVKIQLKIVCDSMEVCKSKPKALSDKFVCFFDETFSIKLSAVPENFSVEIYETTKLFKKKIAEINIDIPIPKDSQRNKINELSFSNKDEISHKHSGVGCGLTISEFFKDYNLDDQRVLETCGFFNYSLSWTHFKAKPAHNQISGILDNGIIDCNKLDEWTHRSNIDPEDPKYSIIFNYLKTAKFEEDRKQENNYFRCDPFLNTLEICKREDLEQNIRFKLLELRDRGEPEFVGMIVPNRIKEIPSNIFTNYKKRLAEENPDEYLQEDDYENEINSRRSFGRKYLQQMHTRIFQMCRNTEHNLTYEDMVNEKVLLYIQLYIKTVMQNILNWFRFQPNTSKTLPNLKPYESEALNIIGNVAPPKIKITLLHAINIPTRFGLRNDDSVSLEVQPYVEVSFNSIKIRSKTGEGKDASWNEELKIPLEAINTDYLSPNALTGSISIKIYDDINESEKMYLGGVMVPISAIFEANKLEGSFLVKLPEVIIGYKKSKVNLKKTPVNELHAFDTYLNMKISTDHKVPKLSPDMKAFATNEPSYIKEHILEWNGKYNENHVDRKFSALVFDSNGKATCITRFIKPLEPPQITEDDFDITLEQCARYISMIPVTYTNKFYQHMWLTTEQLLKLGTGSLIDHTVALMCYLLSLKLEVWLILGFGIPYGSSAYILLREYTVDSDEPIHYIYDISTCKKFCTTDLFCPLQKVYCVVNESNIWGNVQRNDYIGDMRFDFNRRFDWSPLFNQQITAPTYTVQKKLLYVTSYEVQKLQYSIEKKLKKKLSKLLPGKRLTWNHYISNSVKQSISKYEKSLLHGKQLKVKELFEHLENYEMNGFIYNVPFNNINDVVNQTILDKFQFGDNVNKLDLANAVIAQCYPNQVISIWIVLLTINNTK